MNRAGSPPARPGVAFLFVVSALASCTMGTVDFSEKTCPCAPGFTCMDRVCVADTTPGCDAAVQATDFRAVWGTPNTLWWSWTPSGDPEAHLRYEIEIMDASNPSEVLAVLGPEQDPALAHYFLPRTRDDGDLVSTAFSDGLEPERTYAARLVVTDTSLCSFRTPVAAGTTQAVPPEDITIYEDQTSVAGLTPPNYVVTESSGGRMLSWQATTDDECIGLGNDICSQHLQIYPASADLTVIDPGPFANTAYLELRLSYDGATASYYSGILLSLTNEVGARGRFYAGPFRISNTSASRLYQVPLRVLTNGEGDALSTENIEALGGFIYSVSVNGQWDGTKSDGGASTITVDDIRIRY